MRVAVTCLGAFAALALIVSHRHEPYGFEDPIFTVLGAPSATQTWAKVAKAFSFPVVGVVVALCLMLAIIRRLVLRALAYLAIAATALVLSEYAFKPLVQRYYDGELTFPSGSLSGVTATVVAMWLVFFPVLARTTRILTLVLGCVWTLAIALSVVGALWHTPLDDLGSALLSIGVVTGGAAIVEHASSRHTEDRTEQSLRRDTG
jgi:membrane-associated phospholipid phosphatase